MLVNWNMYTLLFCAVAAVSTAFASLKCVHMLQLESYQGNMYLKWLRRSGKPEIISCLLSGLIALFLHMGWVFFYYTIPTLSNILQYAADAAYIIMMAYMGISTHRKQEKKTLVFTGRVIRLISVITVLAFIFHISLFLRLPPNTYPNAVFMLLLRYLPGMLLPLFVLLAHCIALPVENAIKRWYYNDARKILRARADLIKIGITGSYGKTSTKYILGRLLNEKYKTLITPNSYNTPMGVTRVIREKLKPEHEVFIAEMGARYQGDIAELCDLVKPQYGILTSVGKQHLETFGSFEAVVKTKAELIQAIPAQGAIFIYGDNPYCREMYDTCELNNKYMFGLEGQGNLYLWATDITTGNTGSEFILRTHKNESLHCHTVLLGKHNICNIVGAASLAYYMGLSLEEIKAGIDKLEPIDHRLQLIQGAVTVIDDAFNANPAGTKAALEVLLAFAPNKRIIVTPGLIELGDEEEALNEEFGRDIAKAANIAILVGGNRVLPIRKGLLHAGFDENAIVQVANIQEASEKLQLFTTPNAVVLFENDLPDNYN